MEEKDNGITTIAPILAIGAGGFFVYKWLSTKNVNPGFGNKVDEAKLHDRSWLAHGILSPADVRKYAADSGAELFKTYSESGYVDVHDRFGLPWLSRINVEDDVYLTDKLRDISKLQLFSKTTFGKTNYLHICTFTLPDIAQNTDVFWLMFFSAEKKFWNDPNLLTNEAHSWTASKKWKDRFVNRGRYNSISQFIKNYLNSNDPSFYASWHSEDEIKRLYSSLTTKYGLSSVNPKSVDYYDAIAGSRKSVFGQSLRDLANAGWLGSTVAVYVGQKMDEPASSTSSKQK